MKRSFPSHINIESYKKPDPINIEWLMELSRKEIRGLQQSIECWRCGATVLLKDNDVRWPVGTRLFEIPDVPSYYCMSCDELYYPSTILDIVSRHVGAEFDRKPSLSIPRLPHVLRFNALSR